MTVKELIAELQRFAAQDVKGGDMEVILFDKTAEEEYRVDPDADNFGFEVLRGEGQVVIEF